MLERRSALASVEPFEAPGLVLAEAPGFALLQVANPGKQAQALLGKLPKSVGHAVAAGERTLMKTGPGQYWVIMPEEDGLAKSLPGHCALTPLSSSRTRILLEGANARAVLARSAPLDFHPASFLPGMFAMTGIHHTPVLIHCIGADAFHLYVMRTFALSVWEWLVDAVPA